jgi:hypothetical protein
MPFVGCCSALVACLLWLSIVQNTLECVLELTAISHLSFGILRVDCLGPRLSGKSSTR